MFNFLPEHLIKSPDFSLTESTVSDFFINSLTFPTILKKKRKNPEEEEEEEKNPEEEIKIKTEK